MSALKLANRIHSPTLESIGHALAGGSAAALVLILLYPLDQMKVRKATNKGRQLSFSAIIQDFKLCNTTNILDIYRGLQFGIFETYCFNSTFFYFYQLLKNDWKMKYGLSSTAKTSMPVIQALVRGSIAGLCTQLLTTPLKIIQMRLRLQEDLQTSSICDIISDIYSNDGWKGFWAGMDASLILVINPAIVFYMYERIRKYMQISMGRKTAIIDFAAGAIAKTIAAIVCFPLVFAKMNIQVLFVCSLYPHTCIFACL